MRAALRRRDLLASPSLRYAYPRAGLLDGVAWESAHPAVCRLLGVSASGPEEVARMAEAAGKAVAFEVVSEDRLRTMLAQGRLPRPMVDMMVGMLDSGSDQPMTVRRDGQDKTLTVAVAAQPGQDATVQQAAAEQGPKLGLALAPLNDEARQEMNLPPTQKGVVIPEVKQDSPAQMAGLQPGDVLEMVGGQAVITPQQAVTALRAGTQKSGSVALRVLRDGHQAFVALTAAASNDG